MSTNEVTPVPAPAPAPVPAPAPAPVLTPAAPMLAEALATPAPVPAPEASSIPAVASVGGVPAGVIAAPSRPVDMPDYIEEGGEQEEALVKVIRPPRIKIVQDLSKKVKQAFGLANGDVVLLPLGIKLGDLSAPILVTPIFWYSEYVALNPREATALPMIRERKLSELSETARKAKQRVSEPCPELPAKNITYAEVLNFIVYVHGYNVTAMVNFLKGEYSSGSNFAALIKQRGARCFACVYELVPGVHTNRNGDEWYGFDARNCAEFSWVSPDLYNKFKAENAKFKESFDAGLIEAELDEEEGITVNAPTGNATAPPVAAPTNRF